MQPAFLILLCLAGATPLSPKEKPPVVHRIPLPPMPDYSAFDWLVGEWAGKTSDDSPQGEVHLAISYDLGKRVMVFRQHVQLAATDSVPETSETWMGILTPDPSGNGFRLHVFSDTGFITRYRVTVEEASVYLNPEGGEEPPAGWLFRRTLKRTNVGELTETVQVAPPNKAFFNYYTAKLTRTTPPPSGPAPVAAPKPAAPPANPQEK
jgi:hypothetical protein